MVDRDGRGSVVRREVGVLGDRALGEEGVGHGLRLRGVTELLELLALARQARGAVETALADALGHAVGRKGRGVRATRGASDDLTTITSERCGHARGAFSGAARRRVGLVEHADGGVLILDEVLNLPPHAQQLLLDFTQFGTYRPLGHDGPEPRRADVRILGATQGDLMQAIEDGDLSPDKVTAIAERLDVTEADVVSMNRRLASPDHSLNAPLRIDGEGEWQDWLVDDNQVSQETRLAEDEELQKRRLLLNKAMETLNDRERHILTERRLRDDPTTLEDLSQEYSISRERVRQIEVRAFEKLQKSIKNAAMEQKLLKDHA